MLILLALGLFIRLYKIDQPVLGWRQADTAAIARNYYENGFQFFYPQVDWGGKSPGYVETEFPIYSFAASLLYKTSGGVFEFYGRLLSTIFSLIACFYLYLLVEKFTDSKTALWTSVFFLILPFNLLFSRRFQPESALLMSSIAGVYYFSAWLEDEKGRHFLLSAGFISLACLLKIPTLYLGLPLLYLAWLKYRQRLFFQYSLWLYALLVLVPVALWYFHAHQIFLQSGLSFGIWEYGTGKWGNWSLLFTLEFWKRILDSIAIKHFAVFGFILLLIGLALKRKTDQEKVFDYWLVAIFVYIAIVGKGNYTHAYYQLPLTIPAVVFMGKVYGRYFQTNPMNSKSIALGICLICLLVSSGWRYFTYLNQEESPQMLLLAAKVKEEVPEKGSVISYGSNDPTLLYLSHRKGWVADPQIVDNSFLNDKIQAGARYIAGEKSLFPNSSWEEPIRSRSASDYKVVFEDDHSFLVRILRSVAGENATCKFVGLPQQPWKRGHLYNLSVSVENTGSKTWRGFESGPFYLLTYTPLSASSSCLADFNNWGVSVVPLSLDETIPPGESKLFVFQVAAPFRAGTYSFRWQVSQETASGRRIPFGSPTENLCIVVE